MSSLAMLEAETVSLFMSWTSTLVGEIVPLPPEAGGAHPGAVDNDVGIDGNTEDRASLIDAVLGEDLSLQQGML